MEMSKEQVEVLLGRLLESEGIEWDRQGRIEDFRLGGELFVRAKRGKIFFEFPPQNFKFPPQSRGGTAFLGGELFFTPTFE